MKNNLTVVKNELFNEVKTDFYKDKNDNIYMTVKQIALCLGYASKQALESLISRNNYLNNSEFSDTCKMQATDGKSYNTRVFNEDGIYEITFLSKIAVAHIFRAWVRKVIKEIRLTGSYQTPQNNNPTYHIIEAQKALTAQLSTITDDLQNHKDYTASTLSIIGYELADIKHKQDKFEGKVKNYVKETTRAIVNNMLDISDLKQKPKSSKIYVAHLMRMTPQQYHDTIKTMLIKLAEAQKGKDEELKDSLHRVIDSINDIASTTKAVTKWRKEANDTYNYSDIPNYKPTCIQIGAVQCHFGFIPRLPLQAKLKRLYAEIIVQQMKIHSI